MQHYEILQHRCDEIINTCRILANEAHRAGDSVSVWELGKRIEGLEETRRKIHKPAA